MNEHVKLSFVVKDKKGKTHTLDVDMLSNGHVKIRSSGDVSTLERKWTKLLEAIDQTI